jgi:hypothetical protein
MRAASRPTTASSAPRRASSTAAARPIPRVAPVRTTVGISGVNPTRRPGYLVHLARALHVRSDCRGPGGDGGRVLRWRVRRGRGGRRLGRAAGRRLPAALGRCLVRGSAAHRGVETVRPDDQASAQPAPSSTSPNPRSGSSWRWPTSSAPRACAAAASAQTPRCRTSSDTAISTPNEGSSARWSRRQAEQATRPALSRCNA